MGMSDNKYAGLSSHLAGVNALDSVIVPHPVIENLSVLPTGPVPPNPADLLSSERLRASHCRLGQLYKFIVIDSPPIMAATDAVILSVLADGVLIVVRSGETPKDAFTRTRDLLGGVRSRLLGVLLNAVDSNAPDYYYSYRYYPYSYRGYSHDATKPEEPCIESLSFRPRFFVSGGFVRFLITGGAGFIGSHLAERLLERGDEVLLFDNLSTGSMENIRHFKKYDRMHYFLGTLKTGTCSRNSSTNPPRFSISRRPSAFVLIVESPVRTIATNVDGTKLVLETASKKRKLVFVASTRRSTARAPTFRSVKTMIWFWVPRPRAAGAMLPRRRSTNSLRSPTGRKENCPLSWHASSIPWGRVRRAGTAWCCRILCAGALDAPSPYTAAVRSRAASATCATPWSQCFDWWRTIMPWEKSSISAPIAR